MVQTQYVVVCLIQFLSNMKEINQLQLQFEFYILRSFPRSGGSVRNVVFLKTHKTGGGTLSSVLSRYADTNGLELAIPTKELSRFSWPAPFSAYEVDVRRLKKEKANILAHHAVFRFKSEFQKVVLPGAKFITILRHPVQRFESQFFYDNFDKLFNKTTNDNLLLACLNAKESWPKLKKASSQKDMLKLLINGMLFDLTGEQADEKSPKENIDILIKEIESDFDLVLLMEYFDEGLILLRQLLEWKFLDLVYNKQHVRAVRHKNLITEEVSDKILAINEGDAKLYSHFLAIFESRLKSYGENFNRHLEIFRHLNKEVKSNCQHEQSILSIEKIERSLDKLQLTKQEHRLVGDFSSLSRCFCSQLYRDEVSYIKYFKRKFKPYYYIMEKTPPKVFC